MSSSESLLLERDFEMQELGAAFEAVPGGAGRLLLVEGSAGTGKSALIAAALELFQVSALRVLRARGSELEGEFAFGVVRQLFEAMVAEAGDSERERLLAGAAAPAERVIVPEAGTSGDPAAAGFATLHAIYWLAVNAAAQAPLLLVVDDAHWADVSSLRALNHLAAWIGDTPIGLLVALRPDEPGAPAQLLDELRSEPRSLRIALAPLGGDSVARIVRERLSVSDAALCDECNRVSAGNPLYLQELLRAISRNGEMVGSDLIFAVREASAPSLGERVIRRIGRVAEGASGLAAAMAVLGDGGRLTTAAALAGVTDQDAGRFAHRLHRIEVLSDEDPFAFVHPLVRRSVYDTLSITERSALHTSAAELLREGGAPVEKVAVHLGAVAPSASSSVAAVLVEAADEALARAAPDEAIRCWSAHSTRRRPSRLPPRSWRS